MGRAKKRGGPHHRRQREGRKGRGPLPRRGGFKKDKEGKKIQRTAQRS